jgi:GxxExxY protein
LICQICPKRRSKNSSEISNSQGFERHTTLNREDAKNAKAKRGNNGKGYRSNCDRCCYSAIKVHRELGPGLLESAYQYCLARELRKRKYKVSTEVSLPLMYDGEKIDVGYRLDMLVDDLIIIENKTVDALMPIHEAQLLTYLKLSGCHIGFLLNWNVKLMKSGIKRLVHNLPGDSAYLQKTLRSSSLHG